MKSSSAPYSSGQTNPPSSSAISHHKRTKHGFAGADHWHNIVAQFYDVPNVSVQSALFPGYMWDPKSIQKYFVDPVLASPSGHELISEILVAYFQSQICTAWSVATGSSYEAVPVHTAGSEAGAGDAHGLFGGIGQRPGVPEPEKDLAADAAVEKKIAAAAAAAAMKDRGDSSSSPQLLTVPSGRINTRPHGNRPFTEIAPFCVSADDLTTPCHCRHSTARAGRRIIQVGAAAMR